MKFEEWLAEVRTLEAEMWEADFGVQEEEYLPSWSLLRPGVWERFISGTASYKEGYESYREAHRKNVPPKSVVATTRAVHMGDDVDFQYAMSSAVPPEYIAAVNDAHSRWALSKGMPGFPHAVEVSERLFLAGVPAHYAAALVRAGVSEHGIKKYHSAGLTAEYALEVFAARPSGDT